MAALQAPAASLVLDEFSRAGAGPDENRRPLALSIFSGTDNPRERRLLGAIWWGPLMREQADRVAGASNSPDWVMNLRRKGLTIPCKRVASKDRDGRTCQPGCYSLTDDDRRRIIEWMEREGLSHVDLMHAGGR